MTNENAIEQLNRMKMDKSHIGDEYNAIMVAINALSQQTEDAISRQAVINGLVSIAKAKAKSDAQKSLMGRIMFFTERLPSVNSQPKTGHWIDKGAYIDCSECGHHYLVQHNYCPNCGFRMVEPQESEEQE